MQIVEQRPRLALTKTSKEADILIDQLNSRLLKIGELLFGRDITKLTEEDRNKIIALIYLYIQKSYFLGQEYNERVFDEETLVALNDIEKTKELTRDFILLFFQTFLSFKIQEDFIDDYEFYDELDDLDFDLLDSDDLDIDDLDYLPFDELNDLDLDYETILNFDPEKDVTRDNAFQYTISITGPRGFSKEFVVSEQQMERLLDLHVRAVKLEASINMGSADLVTRSLNNGVISNSSDQVQFVTRRDDRVCPICEDLDGEVFDIDPITRIIDGPTIPDDTHHNCRCRYLSLDDDGELLIG